MKLKEYCSQYGMKKIVSQRAGISRGTLQDMIKRDRVSEKFIDRLVEATDGHVTRADMELKQVVDRSKLIPVYTHSEPDPVGVKKYFYEILKNGKKLVDCVAQGTYEQVLKKAQMEVEEITKRHYEFLGITWTTKEV